MNVAEAVNTLSEARRLGLLTEVDKERIREIVATRAKCPACHDKGGWYDGDESEWVSCNCGAA